MLFWRNGFSFDIVALRSQYDSIIRSGAAPLNSAVFLQNLWPIARKFFAYEVKECRNTVVFQWRDNINGQIFRYGKHCNLIVLSMTPEEMRKRIKQANETDDYVLSALLYAVQIFDENYTEND